MEIFLPNLAVTIAGKATPACMSAKNTLVKVNGLTPQIGRSGKRHPIIKRNSKIEFSILIDVSRLR